MKIFLSVILGISLLFTFEKPVNAQIAPTSTPIPTNTPAPTSTPIPTPTPQPTSLSITLLLHGVGAGGDNPNPASAFSNKAPLHPQRNANIQIINTKNQIVLNTVASVNYNGATGAFLGKIDLGNNFPKGSYIIKIKTPRYLQKLFPTVFAINPGINNQLPRTDLIAGDTNNDNVLNILDYNGFLDCGYGKIEPLPMADAKSVFNSKQCKAHTTPENIDIDDNGIVDSVDYNLFLRELSFLSGD